jgi:adenylate cyclase
VPGDNTEHRKLAAIMFTDMVGYSALAQRNDRLALDLLEEHRCLLREQFLRFRGTEIKTIGDAFLVEFASALEAAQCGIEIQRALAKRNKEVPPDRAIELKIGIHIGDIVHRDGDVYGDGVNIASRIEPLAGAGGICVSMDVERQIRNALEARFEKLGPTDLKNIKLPMELFRIILPWESGSRAAAGANAIRKKKATGAVAALIIVLGLIIALLAAKRPKQDKSASGASTHPVSAAVAPAAARALDAKSIAVLPFANLSTERENEFFADGLQDDVITSLARIRDLTVISRTSVQAYRDPAARNLKKIAAELGVATILEGSVRRVGSKVHVNAQLIEAKTDSHLWVDAFDGDASDIFALQARLARQIAEALKATLTVAERTDLERRPTENRQAYNLYLQARIASQKMNWLFDMKEYERVLDLYTQAAHLDAAFALPHVQATILHGFLYWFADMDPSPERKARAEAELRIVRRLAPDTSDLHLAQGAFDYSCRNDWTAALAQFQEAEVALPNDADLQFRIALACRRLGRWQEAQQRFDRAVQLDPNTLTLVSTLTESLFFLRRYEEAIACVDRYLSQNPSAVDLLTARASCRYELDGDKTAYLRALGDLPPPERTYRVAVISGDYDAAEKALIELRQSFIRNRSATIREPVALLRARLAWVRGRKDDARKHAEEAGAAFRSQTWTPRQELWVRLDLAQVAVLMGRIDEGLSEAKAALADQRRRDRFEASVMGAEYLNLLVMCGRRDEAVDFLQEWLSGPCPESPRKIRADPFWSGLKEDPRFDQILTSVKPL